MSSIIRLLAVASLAALAGCGMHVADSGQRPGSSMAYASAGDGARAATQRRQTRAARATPRPRTAAVAASRATAPVAAAPAPTASATTTTSATVTPVSQTVAPVRVEEPTEVIGGGGGW